MARRFRRGAVVLGALVVSSHLLAQTFSTRNDHDDALQAEMGFYIVGVDTGYLVVEAGSSAQDIFQRICLLSVSLNGNVNEIISFGRDSLSCFPGWANGPDPLDDGGLLLMGTTDDGTRLSSRVWRIGGALDSLWSVEVFPDTMDGSIGTMARAKDGAYYVTGSVWHGPSSGQMFLAKLDTLGNVLWTQEYGTSIRDEGYTLEETSDGGFILGGHSWLTSDDHQGYVVKTDGNGNEQWHVHLGGPYRDAWANVIASSDGEYIVAGAYADYQVSITTAYKLYAARLDAGGAMIWERNYGSMGMITGFSSVTALTNDAYVAAGIYSDNAVDKGVLVKFAANGDSLWMRTYQHPPLAGNSSTHWLRSVIEDPDGGLVATGMCYDGQQDLWVFKVDSVGCLIPGCQLYDHIAEAPLSPDQVPFHVLAYPVPADDRLFISFRSAKKPEGEFSMYDAQGGSVRRFSPSSRADEFDIDVGDLPAGIYTLEYQERGSRWVQKVVLQ